MPNATAMDWDGGDDLSTPATTININGGTIDIPQGMVAVGNVIVGSGANLTGMVVKMRVLFK